MIISKMYMYKVYSSDELQEIIKHVFRKKKLSESSINQYSTKIPQWISYIESPKTINKLVENPRESYEILKNTTKIKHSATNHHIYISSVVAYIKYIMNNDKLLKEWKEIEKENWKPIAEHYDENVPTEMQTDKVISFCELNDIRLSLEKGSIERLLLSFYTLIEPIRADYFATEILSVDEEATEDNYIVIDEAKETGLLIVRDFKTKNKYEKIENVISSELMSELRASLDKQPRKYLFTTAENVTKPFTRKLFSNWACRTLTRILKHPMTLTALRHIYITKKLNDKTSTKELVTIAKKMGHSRDIQRIYEWQ